MESYQDLLDTLPAIQLHFSCHECKGRYMRGWFQVAPSMCLFCRTYRAMENIARRDIMLDVGWAFLQSGVDDKGAFYTDYLNQIHRWADAIGITYTIEDFECEQLVRLNLKEEMED